MAQEDEVSNVSDDSFLAQQEKRNRKYEEEKKKFQGFKQIFDEGLKSEDDKSELDTDQGKLYSSFVTY